MPLDCKGLSPAIQEGLLSIPLDEEVYFSSCQNLPYQTKVTIYDTRCRGCGFARLEVPMPYGEKRVFHDVDEAIEYAQNRGLPIDRKCEYPDDVEVIHGQVIFPNVNQIVMNTCRFWNDKNIEM